jgi:hypothetical protein
MAARLRAWSAAYRDRQGRLPMAAEAATALGIPPGTALRLASELDLRHGCGPVLAERGADFRVIRRPAPAD